MGFYLDTFWHEKQYRNYSTDLYPCTAKHPPYQLLRARGKSSTEKYPIGSKEHTKCVSGMYSVGVCILPSDRVSPIPSPFIGMWPVQDPEQSRAVRETRIMLPDDWLAGQQCLFLPGKNLETVNNGLQLTEGYGNTNRCLAWLKMDRVVTRSGKVGSDKII